MLLFFTEAKKMRALCRHAYARASAELVIAMKSSASSSREQR
jgi:hypothetical protein